MNTKHEEFKEKLTIYLKDNNIQTYYLLGYINKLKDEFKDNDLSNMLNIQAFIGTKSDEQIKQYIRDINIINASEKLIDKLLIHVNYTSNDLHTKQAKFEKQLRYYLKNNNEYSYLTLYANKQLYEFKDNDLNFLRRINNTSIFGRSTLNGFEMPAIICTKEQNINQYIDDIRITDANEYLIDMLINHLNL